MREYELLYVVKPDLEEEKRKELQQKLTDIVNQQGGQVKEIKEWGKRRLAYEIANYREGFYVELVFGGETAVVNELDRIIKITDEIIRHIIVRREE